MCSYRSLIICMHKCHIFQLSVSIYILIVCMYKYHIFQSSVCSYISFIIRMYDCHIFQLSVCGCISSSPGCINVYSFKWFVHQCFLLSVCIYTCLHHSGSCLCHYFIMYVLFSCISFVLSHCYNMFLYVLISFHLKCKAWPGERRSGQGVKGKVGFPGRLKAGRNSTQHYMSLKRH